MLATLPFPATEEISFSEEIRIDETLSSEEFGASETYMLHEHQPSEADTCVAMSDIAWSELYPALRSLACYLVRTSPLPYWHDQEEDLVEDIVQETVRRVIERALKAERGEAAPIQSLKQMATTVAYNYCRDLKRRDYRMSRLDTTDTTDTSTYAPYSSPVDVHSDEYLLDIVADKVDQERLFDLLAGEIDHFPPKQKQALLTDLANRMAFDAEPTSLQKSFLGVGIELRHYCQPLPDDQRERGRYISLCSQAYKRVNGLGFGQMYYASEERTRAFVSDHASTFDTKERIETDMVPFMQGPDQATQTENIADTFTKINANEDNVIQSPNVIFSISTLPEPYKTPLRMHMIEKKTYQEIANCMCLPIGTVKSHVSRGMKSLRNRLDTNDVVEQATERDSEKALSSIKHALDRNQIPQPYRRILRLHYVEKQTYATIASKLQIPIGTVKSYINRGKKYISGEV